MTREECEKATEIIDKYVYSCGMAQKPSIREVKESIKLIDKLIIEHFELVDH